MNIVAFMRVSGGITNDNLIIALKTLKESYGIEIDQQYTFYIIKE